MKGGVIHETVMLNPLKKVFRQQNLVVLQQVPARPGFVDMAVVVGTHLLAIEAEMTARRVENDLRKAASLKATWLWIVVPNNRVAESVRAKLSKLSVEHRRPWISILTIGQAMERVTSSIPFFSRS